MFSMDKPASRSTLQMAQASLHFILTFKYLRFASLLAWSLPAVHPHVHSQVAGLREGLAARRALVRPLPAVHPHVHSQVPDCEKALPHVEHSYGRSPLCTRMCTARCRTARRPCRTSSTRTAAPRCAPACAQPGAGLEKALPHVEHSYGRSPLCTRMCTARCRTSRRPCRTSSTRTAAPRCAPACAQPGCRTARRPCRTSSTRTAAPRCAPACAQPGGRTARRPCRTSSTRTAAPRCAPACAQPGAGLREGLAARRALVRPLPAVHPHVHSQAAGLREGLAARRALVRPLPAVHPHVHSQVAGLREGLAARRALVLTLSCIRPIGFRSILPLPLAACPHLPPTSSADMYRTSGSPSRTSSAQSPSSNATPHTTLPLISSTSLPRYHDPSYCTSTTAWYAAASKRTGVCSLSRQMSSRTSPSSKRTRQRGGSAPGIRLTSWPRYHTPSAKRTSTTAPWPAGAGRIVDRDGRPPLLNRLWGACGTQSS